MFIFEKGVNIFNVNINIFVNLKVKSMQILHVASGCPQLKTTFKWNNLHFLIGLIITLKLFDDAGRKS